MTIDAPVMSARKPEGSQGVSTRQFGAAQLWILKNMASGACAENRPPSLTGFSFCFVVSRKKQKAVDPVKVAVFVPFLDESNPRAVVIPQQ